MCGRFTFLRASRSPPPSSPCCLRRPAWSMRQVRVIMKTTSGETDMHHRRDTLKLIASAAVLAATPALAQRAKPMRGVMPIVVTPYKADGSVDYDDLARQMVFYDKCGCTGGAWPQGNGDV